MYWFVPKISKRVNPQTKDRVIAQLNIQPRYFPEKIDGKEPAWTLGAMSYEIGLLPL